jgi:hypothetical protein
MKFSKAGITIGTQNTANKTKLTFSFMGIMICMPAMFTGIRGSTNFTASSLCH